MSRTVVFQINACVAFVMALLGTMMILVWMLGVTRSVSLPGSYVPAQREAPSIVPEQRIDGQKLEPRTYKKWHPTVRRSGAHLPA